MTCWVCNPYCGKCKPPMPKPLKCAVCGKHYLPDVNAKKCIKCGADLPEFEPIKKVTVKCTYSGLLCANPCNRHKAIPEGGVTKPCLRNTPPGDT
jgi:hypothetical protein